MIDFTEDIDSHFNESKVVLEDMRSIISEKAITFAKIISNCFSNNGKLIWCGNGGSAAECLHLSAEFVGRFKSDREPLASIALSSDISALTCISNDYSYEDVFSRQIEALNTSLGMAIGLSTSGKSKNVLSGLKKAKEYGSKTVLITGLKPNNLEFIDIIISFPSNNTGFVQTLTQLVYHSICKCIDQIELSINGE